MRRPGVVFVVTVMLALASIELGACGDKFTRVGRSSRLKGYAPIYPASILVYAPAKVNREDAAEFEAILTRAGHTAVFVPHNGDVAKAAADGRFDLLIVMYDDAAAVAGRVKTLPNPPTIVPILPKSSKKLEPEALRAYHTLLTKYSMSKWDALEALDHAMNVRIRAVAPVPAPF